MILSKAIQNYQVFIFLISTVIWFDSSKTIARNGPKLAKRKSCLLFKSPLFIIYAFSLFAEWISVGSKTMQSDSHYSHDLVAWMGQQQNVDNIKSAQ